MRLTKASKYVAIGFLAAWGWLATKPAARWIMGDAFSKETSEIAFPTNNALAYASTIGSEMNIRPASVPAKELSHMAPPAFVGPDRDAFLRVGAFTKTPGRQIVVQVGASTEVVLTEGVNWYRGPTEADACVSIAAALDSISRVVSSCVNGSVLVMSEAPDTSIWLR